MTSTNWELVPAMCLFAFTIAITPGPNNFMLAFSGASSGVLSSWRHLIGIRIGILFLLLVCSTSIGVTLFSYPSIFLYIKIVGLTYILWLILILILNNPFSGKDKEKKSFNISKATLFQLVNVKAWMGSLSLISTYSIPEDYWLSVWLIILIFSFFGFIANLLWVLLGKYIRTLLNTNFKQRVFSVFIAFLTLLSISPTLFVL
ncbi:LysE family translocator [Vibrio sp. NTOU-M3]|uniref:LysE family translocator n=1 Tax=Vibrio sp. NTOU-M3 TaxID=3234954 RepID=UPI00349F5A49